MLFIFVTIHMELLSRYLIRRSFYIPPRVKIRLQCSRKREVYSNITNYEWNTLRTVYIYAVCLMHTIGALEGCSLVNKVRQHRCDAKIAETGCNIAAHLSCMFTVCIISKSNSFPIHWFGKREYNIQKVKVAVVELSYLIKSIAGSSNHFIIQREMVSLGIL